MERTSDICWPAAALILLSALLGLEPGDSPWFFDMPRLMNVALEFNSTPSRFLGISLPFTPAPYALKGTHGLRYGPFPVWIDQLFLAFTRDPITMVAIRTVVYALMTGFILLWLTRILNVNPWLAVLTMCSPWMLYYSRELWDNSWNVPFCALAFAAYGQFLARPKAWPLCLFFVSTAIMSLVHLMSIPFIVPIVLHLLLFETRSLLKFIWPVLTTVALMLLISTPWLHYFLTFHGTSIPTEASKWHGWIFAFFGAQHLTAWNLGYFLEASWHHVQPAPLRYAFMLARLITLVGFVACWVGMVTAIPWARKAISNSQQASPVDKLCLVGWGVFLCQVLFDGFEHVSLHPHYYNSTWIVFVMFVWLALDAIPRWTGQRSVLANLVVPTYGASLLFVTLVVAYLIHHNGGSRYDHYSAVLSNQMEVARGIAQYSDASPIDMEVGYWQDRQDAPATTFQLVQPPPGDRPVRRLVVKWRNAFQDDARIVVEAHPLNSASTQADKAH